MNLFDRANFSRFKNTYLVRLDRIKREGSPPYTWQFPATAASANTAIYPDTQFPASKKYSPLDWIEVVNNDVVDLTLTINGNESWPVPAGTIRTIDNLALRHIKITNDDSATTSILNKITVTIQRQPLTADRFVRKL